MTAVSSTVSIASSHSGFDPIFAAMRKMSATLNVNVNADAMIIARNLHTMLYDADIAAAAPTDSGSILICGCIAIRARCFGL